MEWLGLFIAFESPSKSGKSTLARMLKSHLTTQENLNVFLDRGAPTTSVFAKQISSEINKDLGYSTAFYWADAVFHTLDSVIPWLQMRNNAVIQDRYDLSVITYRETHGLQGDVLLLDEYLKRDMLLHPDLTVFPCPPVEIIVERIRQSPDSSSIDQELGRHPERIQIMQERFRHHLDRLQRKYVALDTSVLDPQQCLAEIIRNLPKK